MNDINKCYIYVSRPFAFVLKWTLCSVCRTDLAQLGKNRWNTVEKAFGNTSWVVFFWTLFRYLMVMMCWKQDIWRNTLAFSTVEGFLGVLCRGWPRWTLKPNPVGNHLCKRSSWIFPTCSNLRCFFFPSVTLAILLMAATYYVALSLYYYDLIEHPQPQNKSCNPKLLAMVFQYSGCTPLLKFCRFLLFFSCSMQSHRVEDKL